MKSKWIPIHEGEEIRKMSIVTQLINKDKQKHVTIGNPGWGPQNGTIAYMPLPEDISVNPSAWKSEYHGDYNPSTNDWYIVQLQGSNYAQWSYNKLDIKKLYYNANSQKWFSVPKDWDVIGWMAFPKAI